MYDSAMRRVCMRLLPLAVVLLVGCSKRKVDRWQGWFYPDSSNLTKAVELGEFESLEGCRAAAQARVRTAEEPRDTDYECGKNCRPSDYGLNVCEETLH
jgi:hypothetical protein